MWSIFCMDRAAGGELLWNAHELDHIFESCWELPAGAHRRGQRVDQLLTHGNRGSKIGHVLVSPLLFQICINQWMEPIIKHTSKAAPHLSFRPEQTTLRTALYLFRSMDDDWQLWQTHTDHITNRDPGFCKYATNRRFFVCLYVNITYWYTDPVWTSASLQMMGGEGEFTYVTKAATFSLFPMHP